MKHLGPRALTPQDGFDWLKQAWNLIMAQPGLFIAAALLAPVGSAALLALPAWNSLPMGEGWLPVAKSVFCYGLPLTIVVTLSTALARSVNRHVVPQRGQLFARGVLKVLAKASLFLLALLVQGYIAAYLVSDVMGPMALLTTTEEQPRVAGFSFGVTNSILATQLGMLGGLMLVMTLLFVFFVLPLYLFCETPIYPCWRLSSLAMQLNPWLWPALSLIGVTLVLFSSFDIFAVPAQLLALPLPPYLGAVLYIAWLEVFRGGIEEPSKEDVEVVEPVYG